ncbi:MAG: DUF1036 domain-containing protein [Okeania sp. SIO3I5]|uniref:DUF1036 domain-containing protein n=1 Tax=Okeania sp. SIO3I5 TaxID=2607805 RepID=UPI0013B728ED|nr:DUF1036 domain-containing protein [Okeania sp. SIO3I5]NEQ35906.1 DUF1036 domain-containing protein [Okeania sp. SIO3I5]
MAKLSSFFNLIISSGSLLFLFSSAPQSLNAQQSTYTIQFHNKCYNTVRVAINYKDIDGDRITRSWFSVGSNSRSTLVTATSRTFYFYAKSRNGKHTWGGNDLYKSINGSETKYGFRKGTTVSENGVLRQRLTCG